MIKELCILYDVLCTLLCLLFKLLIINIFPIYVRGAVSWLYFGVRHVLFASLRDGDVTVWYQSPRLQQWASMGQEGAVIDAELLLAQQKSDWKFQENCLSVRQSKELTKFTSDVAKGLVERISSVVEG